MRPPAGGNFRTRHAKVICIIPPIPPAHYLRPEQMHEFGKLRSPRLHVHVSPKKRVIYFVLLLMC